MIGFVNGLTTNALDRRVGARVPASFYDNDIVAWGDSLTAGAGASTAAKSYTADVQNRLDGVRGVVNLGVGGQSSTQIAARQGGVPLLLTLSDGAIGAMQAFTPVNFTFVTGLEGWVPRIQAGVTSVISAPNGALEVAATANLHGAEFDIGTVGAGGVVSIAFNLSMLAAGQSVQVGLLNAASGSWTAGAKQTLTATGPYDFTFNVGQTSKRVTFVVSNGVSGTFAFDDVALSVTYPPTVAAISGKSVNVLMASGVYSGSISGMLDGVQGEIITDSGGNWILTRTSVGPALSVAANTLFVPDAAIDLADRTAWIWAGRNNFSTPDSVKADIAAMVGQLGHGRFLVGAILPSALDSAPDVTAIQSLNADLAAVYGDRFVDLVAALQACGNDTPEDSGDVAAGLVPRSLRSDAVHLNDRGYKIVARSMMSAWLAVAASTV